MPVKFKPTTKVLRRGGGVETVHYYMHQTSTEELLEYLESASSKPKIRQKVRNKLTKRGVPFERTN